MTQLSPGVQVREIDLSGIIPSVSTTEGGFAGQFNWGPVGERVLIESENELVRVFGEPDNNNADDWWTAANFLAYSNKLWLVRTVDEDNTDLNLRARNATASNTSGFLVKNEDVYLDQFADGSLDTTHSTGPWIAKFPGDLGNSLSVSICPSSEAFESNLTGTVDIVAGEKTVTGTGTNFTSEIIVGDLLLVNNETHKIGAVISDTELTINTRHVTGATAEEAVRRWEWYAEVDTAPNTSVFADTMGGENDELHVVVVDTTGIITNQPDTVLEIFPNMSLSKDARKDNGSTNYYKNRLNTESRYVWWAAHPDQLPLAGGLSSTTYTIHNLPISHQLVGGNNGTNIGNDERLRGFNKFRSTEDVEISMILGGAANQTVAVHIINNIAEQRADCVAFLSPPRATAVNNEGDEAVDIVNFRNTLPSTSYATIDSGWKYQYDLYNDVFRYVPLNGDTAGLYVRTDSQRDPWYAAAGFNRGHVKNVVRLAWNPSKTDRDLLYKNGINPVATFPGEGTVLWGNKTMLNKPSAFDRMNVRRLFLVLEKAISRASQYFLFEFNDEFSRQSFVNLVEPYLRDVQGRRGITDFRVICNETNNTPEVIDRNEFIGTILIQPARTAEFITLNFVATRTGISFEEVAGRF